MLRWLLPRETNFFDLFEAHARLIVRACGSLCEAMIQETHFPETVRNIRQIEHEADAITHQCIEALHKTFITPIDRNDIHRLIKHMDDIIDYVEDVSSRIEIYKLQPGRPFAIVLANLLDKAAKELQSVVGGLRHLKYAEDTKARLANINRIESEADSILMVALAKLFDEEKDPCNIIKWKEIYENLESAIDRCMQVANIVEGIILEND